eukprot:755420-Prymnesium_polylepis.1
MAGSRRGGCRRHVDYGDLAAGAAAGGEGAARRHVEQRGAQGGGCPGGGNAAHGGDCQRVLRHRVNGRGGGRGGGRGVAGVSLHGHVSLWVDLVAPHSTSFYYSLDYTDGWRDTWARAHTRTRA